MTKPMTKPYGKTKSGLKITIEIKWDAKKLPLVQKISGHTSLESLLVYHLRKDLVWSPVGGAIKTLSVEIDEG